MRKSFGILLLVSVVFFVNVGCGGSPMEKIRAWLPQFETACQRSAAVKAEISATDSVDQKMQIKKAKLDPVNQKLGELQKELKALLKELSDAERADVQSQVQKILTQYGVS